MAEFRESRKGVLRCVLRINTQFGAGVRRQLRLAGSPEFFLKTGFQNTDYFNLRTSASVRFLF